MPFPLQVALFPDQSGTSGLVEESGSFILLLQPLISKMPWRYVLSSSSDEDGSLESSEESSSSEED